MTRAEIIALQESLNQQGFALVVDGRYGQKTRDAYAEYLDRDNAVPTQVPPAPKPWWTSKTAIAILSTILVSGASLAGITLDGAQLTEALGAATTLVISLMALWANARRDAPLDRGLVLPGLRIPSRADPVRTQRATDQPPGPFGY
jgi:peptidoglycan hydrolase-like protein with peptidoglycan-binding domain